MIQRQSNTEIANEWHDLQKRARTDRTVNVNGMASIVSEPPMPEVISSSLLYSRNFGVHLLRDQVVAKPMKRERIKFESEEWCNYCRDGGELVLCNLCSRGNA